MAGRVQILAGSRQDDDGGNGGRAEKSELDGELAGGQNWAQLDLQAKER